MDDLFLSFNPVRRTPDAVDGIEPSSEKYEAIINQEQLNSSFTLDAYIGKSFRFQHKYYLSINLNVSNILNNQDYITGGYEQLRFDNELDPELRDPNKFEPKYFYYYGTTYYLNISFRF